jgi:uncharacterized protein (DUF1778 family)
MARDEALKRAQEAYEEKTSKLNLRLRKDERAKLDRLANQAGVTPTRWLRDRIEEA